MDGELGAVGTTVAAEPAATTEVTTETTTEETPVTTPTEGTTPEGTPAEGAEPTDGAEPTEETEEEEDLGGEAGTDEIGKKISALKKTNPEAAKAWAKDHYSLNAYKQEFETVQAARAAKATIESLGGEEGINELQDEVSDYRGEIEQFSNGDPQLITQLYEANPDGLVTAGQNLLQLLGEKDLQRFDAAMIPSMYGRLENAGVYELFERIGQFIQQGKGQEAWDTFKPLKEWFGKLKGIAEKTGETRKQRDPERDRLEQERQQFESERARHANERVATDVNKLNNTATAKLVEPFFKDIKLKPEGRKSFVDQLNSRIYAAMKNDKTFQRQAKAIKTKNDYTRTAKFINAKFAELLPDHFRALRNALYPNYTRGGVKVAPKPGAPANGAAPAAPANGATQVASGATLTAKPNRDDVDWAKTSDINWITGRNVVLKNGKTVNIDWKQVRT